MFCLSLRQRFLSFLENSQIFVKKFRDLEEGRDFNSQICSLQWGLFLHWLLHCLPTKMVFWLWGLMRVQVEHNFMFRWQYRIYGMKPSCILLVLYAYFILVLGTPTEDPGMRNVLKYSARSLNSAGQGEEFCFPEFTTFSRVIVFRFCTENTVQKSWMLASWWKGFFSLLCKSKITSGPPASCWRAAEPWGEMTAHVS